MISSFVFNWGGGIQLDICSPYLFFIAIQLFAHEGKRDRKIKMIHFGEHEIRQVLYAE